jgi:dTDP-4-amino-4,6-dideoxygalactose transaminase
MSRPTIPLFDPKPEVEDLFDELDDVIRRVVRSGRYILGPEVTTFEQEAAAYLGSKHAIAVNSGTDALVIALRALGIGSGDEVITTPYSFVATAEAIRTVGAEIVFVDIEPETFNLDVKLIESRITSRTRAILPVHLFGHAVEMDSILQLAAAHGLKVLEDVAQAFGGTYQGSQLGTLGDAGAYSFFPSKNLGAFGDGGLIATDDDDVADMARVLRGHGAKDKYLSELIGYNSRLDELQASILRVKLPRVELNNDKRRNVAGWYREQLGGLTAIQPPCEQAYARHVYQCYTLRVSDPQRAAVQASLAEAGVGTAIYYQTPIHLMPPYRQPALTLAEAERAAGEVLSLPMGPHVTQEDVQHVARTLSASFR